VLALAAMGKHLQSMMAAQGLFLATSQNLQERIRMRKRRRSGGSSSEEEPRSGRGNSAAGQKAIYQPREPTGLYTTVRGDADCSAMDFICDPWGYYGREVHLLY
jgi:hypothetical protein